MTHRIKSCVLAVPHAMMIGLCASIARADAQPTRDAPRQRPNLVIIFMDDRDYTDVGCYGATGFETPHLDRMAAEGTRFTDFYPAAPAGTPARAALTWRGLRIV